MIRKVYNFIIATLVAIMMVSQVSFVFAANERELTDDEKAAFIVRDEWTSWVRDFTASLSELDKNATSKIYDNMDFYDMQYRFTEKYKKVPEYLDEDGKPTQKLKDMIKTKRKELAGATIRDYLCFTSNAAGSKISYAKTGSVTTDGLGISTDGVSFVAWDGSEKTIGSGETLYIVNKRNSLSTGSANFLHFNITGNVSVSGDISSLINFSDISSFSFFNLFSGCTGLTNAEDLVLSKTAVSSYNGMFYNCTNLTRPPVLSATSLSASCYDSMFAGCTNLTSAPKLPATTLANACYRNMFSACSSLTTAPDLPATTLANSCYQGMFNGCSSLNSISLEWEGNFSGTGVPTDAFTNWVNGVANSGTFYYSGSADSTADSSYGASAMPKNSTNKWTIGRNDYLRFISRKNGSQVGYSLHNLTRNNIYYSKDRVTWTQWNGNYVTIDNGETLYVHNRDNQLATSTTQCLIFNMPNSGEIEVAGNIMSLANFNTTVPSSCFYGVFAGDSGIGDGCDALVDASSLKLPSAIAAECYREMFNGCRRLVYGPTLPATTLASNCYMRMFQNCTSLISIKLGYTGSFDNAYFAGWVNNINTVGTLYYNGTGTVRGGNGIPTNWSVVTY
ncbi:MAG: leucine-rich repeat protein [Lachnospiraceae bacterium]|nr:leucine-rich repeat protein [Lachnospiraceae bacterium]